MSNEKFDETVNDLSKDLIKKFEENEQRKFQFVRKNFGALGSKFEELMFEVKKKVEEKGYIFDYFIQTFDGDTDTCIVQIKQDTEENTENWYD